MLCRLLYVSRVAPAAASQLASTMEDVLIVSVHRNRADVVTGFLLADGDHFVQVLEGPDERVTACYERILKDDRHTDVRLRLLSGIERRLFPRWSMCGLCLSPLDDAILSPPDIGFDVVGAEAGALLQHLRGVSVRYARTLDAAHARLIA